MFHLHFKDYFFLLLIALALGIISIAFFLSGNANKNTVPVGNTTSQY